MITANYTIFRTAVSDSTISKGFSFQSYRNLTLTVWFINTAARAEDGYWRSRDCKKCNATGRSSLNSNGMATYTAMPKTLTKEKFRSTGDMSAISISGTDGALHVWSSSSTECVTLHTPERNTNPVWQRQLLFPRYLSGPLFSHIFLKAVLHKSSH